MGPYRSYRNQIFSLIYMHNTFKNVYTAYKFALQCYNKKKKTRRWPKCKQKKKLCFISENSVKKFQNFSGNDVVGHRTRLQKTNVRPRKRVHLYTIICLHKYVLFENNHRYRIYLDTYTGGLNDDEYNLNNISFNNISSVGR